MKSTVMFFLLFFLLALTFLLLSIGHFANRLGVTRAGGVLGVVVAFIAWYNAYAGVATKQNSYVLARPFPLPSTERVIF
ncbi:CNT_collapsed_G0005640.mRNA.1.CDS.1 [Saccharomyces cerevisiae]|nr:CNT_collapsed_G0005640.mRNA.1.CDS.1 [Saccharomyces cerevisiae]